MDRYFQASERVINTYRQELNKLVNKLNMSVMTNRLKLPPDVGMHQQLRKDGTYGYVCNACGYPVGDHDGYCSECGARVAGTYFYYGKYFDN